MNYFGGLLSSKVPKELKHFGGVYIISAYSNPAIKNTSRVKVKIGYAKHDLYSRLDSYHTGFVDSFWIYSVITCKNERDSFELEKYIHKLLLPYRYKNIEYEARLKGEWFFLRKALLRSTLNKAIVDKYDLIRGLFNYNKNAFALTLPDLGNNPKRTLYPSADDEEVAGARPNNVENVPQPLRTKRPKVYFDKGYKPVQDINAPPKNKVRTTRPVTKVKPSFTSVLL